jgi:hypothetical protein
MRSVYGVILTVERGRKQREEVLFFSEAKEPTQIIFGIADRMRAFSLRDKIGLDCLCERGEGTIAFFKRAMLGIGIVQGFGQDPYSRLQVFAHGDRKGRGKECMELGERHGKASSTEIFSAH